MGTSSEDTLQAAIKGLVQKVVLIFTITLAASSVDRVKANLQGDALLAFRDTFMNGDVWFESWSNVSTNNSPCGWQFVRCDNNGNVRELQITTRVLVGSLVPALGSLKHLQTSDLHANELAGTSPDELGNLTNLITLDSHQNRLGGQIPHTLCNNANLKTLNLGCNKLQGTCLESNTSKLSYLDLSSNRFSGEITCAFNNTEILILDGI